MKLEYHKIQAASKSKRNILQALEECAAWSVYFGFRQKDEMKRWGGAKRKPKRCRWSTTKDTERFNGRPAR